MRRDDPPKSRTGECIACSGTLTEIYKKEYNSSFGAALDLIGPGSMYHVVWKSGGLHCPDCGLSYHNPPSEAALLKKKSDGQTDK